MILINFGLLSIANFKNINCHRLGKNSAFGKLSEGK